MQLPKTDNTCRFPSPLRIAIGKGRGFAESVSLMEMPDTPAFKSFMNGDVPVFHDTTCSLTVVTVRSRDLCWMLEQGHIDVAIGSSIWFREYGLSSLSCLQPLPMQQCRLSLIAPSVILPQHIHTICTKFTSVAQRYIAAHNMNARIIPMEGTHETALYLHIADAIIDVIETGRTIRRMGFCELDTITTLQHEIWTRKTDMAAQELFMSHLKQPVC
ncbi:MAG: ATP phosphoribosyltransferase [Chitinophaga sp.]|uniref:ATP phosphoribosyltransferase n=1 Tax=Chitinophaga sp. TaxID=1869181 RepID=UPI001B02C867|nr:ATP phosphoribosyltransferase [Chitinophaga sp.]MBO9728438.1 ATP phosphoribosyltransferase [Chitinophaga sp.]